MKDLNVNVKSGRWYIVGPTGAGVNTIINLLLRFYDVKGGSIKIDGADIRDLPSRRITLDVWNENMRHLGYILGTIYDNICYGRLDAT